MFFFIVYFDVTTKLLLFMKAGWFSTVNAHLLTHYSLTQRQQQFNNSLIACNAICQLCNRRWMSEPEYGKHTGHSWKRTGNMKILQTVSFSDRMIHLASQLFRRFLRICHLKKTVENGQTTDIFVKAQSTFSDFRCI